MRRSERAFTDAGELFDAMRRCRVAFIAFSGEPPYVVPMNFGVRYADGRFSLYLHGAGEGEKHRRLSADPRAAFSMVSEERLLPAEIACGYSEAYESVCGDGCVRLVEGSEKREGLRLLMDQLAPNRSWTFDEPSVRHVTVLRLDVEHISGKRRRG